jgi:hypothetical protein
MLHIFSIYDTKANAYLQPFIMPTVSEATRLFGDCVTNPEHPFGKHPEDYSLFLAGTFNVQSGKFEMLETLNCLGQALQFTNEDEIDIEQNITVPTFDKGSQP